MNTRTLFVELTVCEDCTWRGDGPEQWSHGHLHVLAFGHTVRNVREHRIVPMLTDAEAKVPEVTTAAADNGR